MYGGRGISMRDEWVGNPVLFCEYVMGLEGYDESRIGIAGISLDRIDTNGNYDKGNIRWASPEIQARNRNVQSNNTSGFSGIYWIKKIGKFQARVGLKSLGYTATAIEANEIRIKYITENNIKGYRT